MVADQLGSGARSPRARVADTFGGPDADALRRLQGLGEPLERVLPAFTSNVTRVLLLSGKGQIAVGADADLGVSGVTRE